LYAKRKRASLDTTISLAAVPAGVRKADTQTFVSTTASNAFPALPPGRGDLGVDFFHAHLV